MGLVAAKNDNAPAERTRCSPQPPFRGSTGGVRRNGPWPGHPGSRGAWLAWKPSLRMTAECGCPSRALNLKSNIHTDPHRQELSVLAGLSWRLPAIVFQGFFYSKHPSNMVQAGCRCQIYEAGCVMAGWPHRVPRVCVTTTRNVFRPSMDAPHLLSLSPPRGVSPDPTSTKWITLRLLCAGILTSLFGDRQRCLHSMAKSPSAHRRVTAFLWPMRFIVVDAPASCYLWPTANLACVAIVHPELSWLLKPLTRHRVALEI